MLGHLKHAFARHRAASENILQKWQHILALFRAAERHHNDRVVRSGRHG